VQIADFGLDTLRILRILWICTSQCEHVLRSVSSGGLYCRKTSASRPRAGMGRAEGGLSFIFLQNFQDISQWRDRTCHTPVV